VILHGVERGGKGGRGVSQQPFYGQQPIQSPDGAGGVWSLGMVLVRSPQEWGGVPHLTMGIFPQVAEYRIQKSLGPVQGHETQAPPLFAVGSGTHCKQ